MLFLYKIQFDFWSCFFYGIPSSSVQNVSYNMDTYDDLMFPQYRTHNQRETKIYECRHKSGKADAELQRGVNDLPRSRVPCSNYTVSTSLRA